MRATEPTATGLWARLGGRIARRPRIVWATTAVILGAMALGMPIAFALMLSYLALMLHLDGIDAQAIDRLLEDLATPVAWVPADRLSVTGS